ncbi:hypothetical protein K1719_014532 [Acacia pycnantha]|nr:hypothetical protein K1719_014532 [Acacia pycnantha]
MSENENGKERRRAPKGHFVVYVGKEQRRCELPVSYLKDLELQKLMEEAAKEYGYKSRRIVLPCEESAFKKITDQIKFNNNGGKFC